MVDGLLLLSPINNFEQKMKGFVLKNFSVECASGKMIIINNNYFDFYDRQYFLSSSLIIGFCIAWQSSE